MKQEEQLNYPYEVDPPTIDTDKMKKGYIGIVTKIVGCHQGMCRAGEYLVECHDTWGGTPRLAEATVYPTKQALKTSYAGLYEFYYSADNYKNNQGCGIEYEIIEMDELSYEALTGKTLDEAILERFNM